MFYSGLELALAGFHNPIANMIPSQAAQSVSLGGTSELEMRSSEKLVLQFRVSDV